MYRLGSKQKPYLPPREGFFAFLGKFYVQKILFFKNESRYNRHYMKTIGTFVALGLFSVGLPAYAASLYMDPGSADLKIGDSVTMAVRLDVSEAAGECVNAVDATINYSPEIEPVDISLGQSIFRMWVEEPTIDKNKNQITFAGGIPNGYCGRISGDPQLTNKIIEIVFVSAKKEILEEDTDVIAEINFSENTNAYLNDGFGTVANLRTDGSTIVVKPELGGDSNQWLELVASDRTAPEPFSISLQKGNGAFSDKYYIVFNTTDKQTGIDHYEIIEEPLDSLNIFRFGAANAPWITARSPYVLDDQNLNSTIRVKAFDNAGNFYMATLVPDEHLRNTPLTEKISKVIIIIFLALMVVSPVIMVVNRRRTVKNRILKQTNSVTNYEDKP